MSGGAAISPDMAARLGKLCGNSADLWLTLQARYDAWEATQRLAEQLGAIPPLRENRRTERKDLNVLGEIPRRTFRRRAVARVNRPCVGGGIEQRASDRLNDRPRRLLGRLSRR